MQARTSENVLTTETVESPAEQKETPAQISLEALLEQTPSTNPDDHVSPDLGTGMRSARVVHVSGRTATLAFRNYSAHIKASIAPEVDPEIISDARANGDNVLVEVERGFEPVVVGVIQTRRPKELHIKAETVHIEGEREVLFKSGNGAMRIREDGDIEVVGSRISAASRGLFRIVGRLLRLN